MTHGNATNSSFKTAVDDNQKTAATQKVRANVALTRRGFLGGAVAGAAIMAAPHGSVAAADTSGFTHGVASGDPTQDAVVLWTRYVTGKSDQGHSLDLVLEISTDPSFRGDLIERMVGADPNRDHIAKIDVTGLAPNTTYFYRFKQGDDVSVTGRTKTLPESGSLDPFKLALLSCSNYPQGLFHVYREVAMSDLDLVLHLGDYIYEYEAGKYSNEEALRLGRAVKPANEITSLSDYRTRYALYRSDADLQAAHAAHPFICVWDDHETANDSWKAGAENHQPDIEGDYNARRIAAHQAWMDWLPVRETAAVKQGVIYRTFELGSLASLIMMDTRIVGRDKPLDYQEDMSFQSIPFDFSNPAAPKPLLSKEAYATANPAAIKKIPVPFDLTSGKPKPVTDWETLKTMGPDSLPKGFAYIPDTKAFKDGPLSDPDRTILGAEQEDWLKEELSRSVKSGKKWQLLGQQLLMGKVIAPALSADQVDFSKSKFVTPQVFQFFQLLAANQMPLNLDAWDGYAACRDRVYDMIRETGAAAISFAGDTHNAWGFNLADDKGQVAVEIGTPGVSSPGLEVYLPIETEMVESALQSSSNELDYVNASQRGWTELTLSSDHIDVSWRYISSVLSQDYTVSNSTIHRIIKDEKPVLRSL